MSNEEHVKGTVEKIAEVVGEIAQDIDEANLPSLTIEIGAKVVETLACAVDKSVGGSCEWKHDKEKNDGSA